MSLNLSLETSEQMNSAADSLDPPGVPAPARGGARDALRSLLPYLWQFRARIAFALSLMLLAKLANVGVPLVLQKLVDRLDVQPSLLLLPVGLLMAYGAARLSTTIFTELRQLVFARVMALVSRLAVGGTPIFSRELTPLSQAAR